MQHVYSNLKKNGKNNWKQCSGDKNSKQYV